MKYRSFNSIFPILPKRFHLFMHFQILFQNLYRYLFIIRSSYLFTTGSTSLFSL